MSDEQIDLEDVWERATDSLSHEALSPQQRAWIRLTRPIGLVEDTALLAAPNSFAQDVFQSRLLPIITAAISRQLGRIGKCRDHSAHRRRDAYRTASHRATGAEQPELT